MHRPILASLCSTFLFFACDGCQGIFRTPPDGGCDASNTCVTTPPSTCDSGFCIQVIDSASPELQQLAIAVQPDDTVSIAYLSKTGQFNELDAGNAYGSLYSIKYAEWKGNTVTGPQSLPTWLDGGISYPVELKRAIGIALALQANGQPAVAFLGGSDDTQAFWFQHEAYLDTRDSSGTWSAFPVAQRADTVANIMHERIGGFLVGLYPALAFDANQGYLAYRDCHNGETSTDWGGSDVQVGIGTGTTWPANVVDDLDTYGKNGDGNHMQLVIANGTPTLFYDRNTQAIGNDVTDTAAHDLVTQSFLPDGGWTQPIRVEIFGDTQLGPSVAYDPTLGFVAAVYDASSVGPTAGNLNYMRSANGLNGWTSPPNAVVGGESGGWWPSLAIDPVAHIPHIAYHHCSSTVGLQAGTCPTAEQSLMIAHLGPDQVWHKQPVDPEGGFVPKLAFLSSGKRVVVYRVPQGPNKGNVKIAVEQ